MKWWWLAVVACVIVFNPYWKIENYKLVRITGASKADYVAGNSSAAASDSSGVPKVISVVGPLSRWVDDPDDKQEAVERPAYKAHPLDRIIPTPAAGANHFLHKTLVVPKYVIYQVNIPPGSTGALLSGSFEAFTRSAENEAQAASIQVLLLDDAEVRDFARGKPGSVTYSTEASTSNRSSGYSTRTTRKERNTS